MGNEEVGLGPVPALGCWEGFVGSSCLELPKPLGPPSSPWERSAGSSPALPGPLLVPCCDLGVGSPAFLRQPLPGRPGKALPQQLPDPAAWLPAGPRGAGGSPRMGGCRPVPERGWLVPGQGTGCRRGYSRVWERWQRGRRGTSLSSSRNPSAFKLSAFFPHPLGKRLHLAWRSPVASLPFCCSPLPLPAPPAPPSGREGCTDSWVLPSPSPGAL